MVYACNCWSKNEDTHVRAIAENGSKGFKAGI